MRIVRTRRHACLLVVLLSAASLLGAIVPAAHASDGQGRSTGIASVQTEGAASEPLSSSSRSSSRAASDASPSAPLGPTPPWWLRWDRDHDGDGIDDRIRAVHESGPSSAITPDGFPIISYRLTSMGIVYDVFVRFDGLPSDEEMAAVTTVVERLGGSARLFDLAESIHVRDVTYAAIEALAAIPGVRGIEADRTVVPFMDIASRSLLVMGSRQLGNGARARWGVSGRDVGIAVLDTGIDEEHPAFGIGDRFIGGYDATAWLARATPLSQTDPDSDDFFTHGTHVAHIAVGVDRIGRWIGVAPQASFLDIKVMARELAAGPLTIGPSSLGTDHLVAGTGSSVIEGMEFVRRYNDNASYLGDPGVRQARVVVMAFGENEPDVNGTSVLARAVDNLVATGVIVVAAAGNCGPDGAQGVAFAPCTKIGSGTIAAPGSATRAITVGAMDDKGTLLWDDDEVALFSSRGRPGGPEKPDVMAYGVEIAAARGDPRLGEAADRNVYQNLSGTSMAAPQVAGIAALMLEVAPWLTPDQVKQRIIETARPVGEDGFDIESGHGLANGFAAVGVGTGWLTVEAVQDEYERLRGDFFGVGAGHDDDHDHDDHDHDTDVFDERAESSGRPDVGGEEETRRNARPVADFDIHPERAPVGQPLRFFDRSTDPNGDKIASRVWDFGDGTVGRGERTQHAYDRPGEYIVTLTVVDANESRNLTSSATAVVEIFADESEEAPLGPLWLFALVVGAAFVALRRRQPTTWRP